jgi:N-acetylglucosamine kinase-like BadF-type ATPase
VNKSVIDAGGTRTLVRVVPTSGEPRQWELPSINPSAGGRPARDALGKVFGGLRDSIDDGPTVGWLASASLDPSTAQDERSRINQAFREAGLRFPLVISNDVVPLLWGVSALAGRGVVVVCGTGSGVLGGDGSGRILRAGGCEYLGSDEGSAFDLGFSGLRAAVRALDGRGAATGLVDAFAEWAGCPAPALARALAIEPYPKQRVASLAAVVCRTWLAGDVVAADIVRSAIVDLSAGVRAVRDRLSLPGGFAVAASGGVLHGCPPFFRELAEHLSVELQAGSVVMVQDPLEATLEALTRLLGPDGRPLLPTDLQGHHAWVIDG